MKDAKIAPLTVQQYAEISEDIHDETHRVERRDDGRKV